MATYQEHLINLDSDPIWEELDKELGVTSKRGVHTSSEIADYTECPQMASLKYGYEGPPSAPETRNIKGVRGTAAHKAIQRLHSTKKWKEAPDVFLEAFQETLDDPESAHIPIFDPQQKLLIPDTKGRTEMDKIRDAGVAMIENYAALNHDAEVEAVEIPGRMLVSHPTGKSHYRLALTIDQLRPEARKNPHPQVQMPRAWEVWDTKSSEKAPSPDWLARAKQFTIYGLGVREARFVRGEETFRIGQAPTRFVWYHLHHLVPYERPPKGFQKGDFRGDPIIETFRDEEDYLRMRRDIGRIFQAIRMKIFFRAEGKSFMDNCKMCDVRHACTVGAPTPGLQFMDMGDLDGLGI